MEIQEPPLPFGEAADVDHTFCFDSHSGQRLPVSDRRDDQLAGILEADEFAINR
jgi:hypothetical protein